MISLFWLLNSSRIELLRLVLQSGCESQLRNQEIRQDKKVFSQYQSETCRWFPNEKGTGSFTLCFAAAELLDRSEGDQFKT